MPNSYPEGWPHGAEVEEIVLFDVRAQRDIFVSVPYISLTVVQAG